MSVERYLEDDGRLRTRRLAAFVTVPTVYYDQLMRM